MKPGITLTMIVKDEADKLARCLDSVVGVVDAIAIVDTGSTDRSGHIAKAHGADLAQIEWPGAFDEARNESLKLVQTEWILWLDADEWLPRESGAKIRQAVTRDDAFCLDLIRKEHATPGEAKTELPRLWRSRPYVPFVGVVHEHLDLSILAAASESRKEYTTDIEFLHDGYSGGLAGVKLDRYIPMLREELRRRPGQIYYEVKLACTLASANSPEAPAALQTLGDRLVAEQDRDDQDVVVASSVGFLLEAISDAELRSARTDALVRSTRAWFPDSPTVAWHAAQLEIRRGDLPAAIRALLDVETMADTGRYDRRTPCPAPVLGIGLWTNLALVAHQLGRKDVARRNYERILAVEPDNSVAMQNIRRL